MIASNYMPSVRTPTPAARALPTVLLAGPWELPEFAVARRGLPVLESAAIAPTLAAAIGRVGASVTPPELVLVAAPRPGLVTHEEVEQLGTVAPLARLVVVAGSWCEGEWRTGRPPAGVVRLYWHELAPWWRVALAALAEGFAPPWSAPLDEPRAGQMPVQRAKRGAAAPCGLIAVDAIDLATFEALAAGLAEFGWKCYWRPRGRNHSPMEEEPPPFSGGIWDGGQLDDDQRQALRQFCVQMRTQRAPVIALVDYPRAEHATMIAEAGAAAMFGKPYQVALVANELLRLI